jgi:hypothetical protein
VLTRRPAAAEWPGPGECGSVERCAGTGARVRTS